MNPVIQNVIAYTTIIFLSFFIMNFLSSGFLIAFIKAKAGRGKRVLLFVEGRTGNYFKVAEIKEDELYYKNREGTAKILTIQINQIRRLMNIPFLQIDDVKNAVQNPDFSTASGHDSANVDNLLQRCLMAPSSILDRLVKIILVVVIVELLLLLVIGFLVFSVKTGQGSILGACSSADANTLFIKNLLLNNSGVVI